MYKRILVPLDGSDVAEAALPLVLTLADTNGSEVVLFRVVEYPPDVYSIYDHYHPNDPRCDGVIQEKKQTYLAAAETYLESIADPIRKNNFVVLSEVWEGPVVEAIQAAAKSLDVDLIVLSAHGHSTGSLCGIIGAVANRLLNTSKIPVILANNLKVGITV